MARSVQFVADGQAQAGERHTVSADDVASSFVRFSSRVPARVAVAMAGHESSFTVNERDTEDSGFVSDGIYQISRGEAVRALFPEANLFDLDDSSRVIAYLLEDYLDQVLAAAQDAFSRGLGKNPLDEGGAPIDDVWALVAVTHNIGPGDPNAAIGSRGTLPGITALGLNWPSSFQEAHPSMTKQVAYGSDAITGGPSWRPELEAIVADPGASSGHTTRAVVLLIVLGLSLIGLGRATGVL